MFGMTIEIKNDSNTYEILLINKILIDFYEMFWLP